MVVLIVMCLFICFIDCSGFFLTGRVQDLLYCGYFDDMDVDEEDNVIEVSEDNEELQQDTETKAQHNQEYDEESEEGIVIGDSMNEDDFDKLDEEDKELYLRMHGQVDENKSRKDATALLKQIYGGD